MTKPNEEQVRKINAAIERIAAAKAEAGKRLASMVALHAAAWEEYGSELCANGMSDDQDKIRKEIAAHASDIALLEQCLEDATPLNPDPDFKAAFADLKARLIALKAEGDVLHSRLDRTVRARELIGI